MKTCFCPDLQLEAYGFILGQSEESVHHGEFLQLSAQELSEILDADDLNVRKESSVYDAILRWTGHMPEDRLRNTDVLFSKVQHSWSIIKCWVLSY